MNTSHATPNATSLRVMGSRRRMVRAVCERRATASRRHATVPATAHTAAASTRGRAMSDRLMRAETPLDAGLGETGEAGGKRAGQEQAARSRGARAQHSKQKNALRRM